VVVQAIAYAYAYALRVRGRYRAVFRLLRLALILEVFAQDAQHSSQGFRGAPEQLIANREGP
jgi:hypothetical protein